MSYSIEEISPLSVKEPFDLMRYSIDEIIVVKMKNGRKLRGKLHAYDLHLNMVLGDVEETITDIDIDVETLEEIHSETKRVVPLVFLRGENVILISSWNENEFTSYEDMLH